MLKYFFALFAFAVLIVLAMAGFRGTMTTRQPLEFFPDMDDQPKVKAQTPSAFFADGSAARKPVAGTVPLGYESPINKAVDGEEAAPGSPYHDIQFSGAPIYVDTGKMGDNWGTGFPFDVTPAVMTRGQERYNISCAICHGATGAGDGMAKQFGVNTVQSLLLERIRIMADGEIYDTITHGKNTMLGYGPRIQVSDRWAIIAYVRALQKSQGGATLSDVPAAERVQLESQ